MAGKDDDKKDKASKDAATDVTGVLAKMTKQISNATRIAAVTAKEPAKGVDDLATLIEDLIGMADDLKKPLKILQDGAK